MARVAPAASQPATETGKRSHPGSTGRRASVDIFQSALNTHSVLEQVKDVASEVQSTVGQTYRDVLASEESEQSPNVGCILHPESTYRLVWHLLLVVFLLYMAVMIPLRIAFDTDAMPTAVQPYSGIFWLEVCTVLCLPHVAFV